MTDRLEARPVDPVRKLPIPYVAEREDGTPDFAALQGPRLVKCAEKKLCGVCGQSLGYWIVFLGGPRCVESRAYVDPPMHEECAEVSLRLCPHIAHRETKRSRKLESREDVVTPAGFVDAKPTEWVMYYTRSYDSVLREFELTFRPAPAKRLRRFTYDGEGNLKEDISV